MLFKHKIRIISGILATIVTLGTTTPVLADTKDNVDATNKTEEVVIDQRKDNTIANSDNQSNTFIVPKNATALPEANYNESKFAPALAGVYFIPGIGEVALTATGVVVAGGIAYGAGSAIYNLVKKAINSGNAKKRTNSGHTTALNGIKKKVPNSLKKKNGNVDIDSFVNKKGQRSGNTRTHKKYKRWEISKDRDGHKGSKWKLLRGGKRIASLAGDGRIVGK